MTPLSEHRHEPPPLPAAAGGPGPALERLLDAAPVAVSVTAGPDHRYIYANPAYRAIRPGSMPDIIGRAHAEVFPEVAEAGRVRTMDEAFRTGLSQHYTRGHDWGDGRGPRYRKMDVLPWREGEVIGGLFIFGTDVTSELRAILDTVPASIFIAHDPACQRITTNRVGAALLQAAHAPCAAGRAVGDASRSYCALEDDGCHLQCSVGQALRRAAGGELVTAEETELRHGNGESLWLHGSATPVRDALGRLTGAVGAFVDVTQRKQDEIALAEAKRQAEEASRAKSQFLAAVSHDLRQPVHALGMYIDVIAELLPEPRHRAVGLAKQSIERLTGQLSAMLDLCRFDTGQLQPAPSTFDLGDLLEQVVATLRPLAEDKGLRLRARPCARRICTDRALFERLLANLVSNAIRYTGKGGVLLACRRSGGRDWVEVWDSGIGIPGEQINEIFDEFHQLGNPGRNSDNGTGLGLAIVERIAKVLELRITVRSRVGRGSVFAVELPE